MKRPPEMFRDVRTWRLKKSTRLSAGRTGMPLWFGVAAHVEAEHGELDGNERQRNAPGQEGEGEHGEHAEAGNERSGFQPERCVTLARWKMNLIESICRPRPTRNSSGKNSQPCLRVGLAKRACRVAAASG